MPYFILFIIVPFTGVMSFSFFISSLSLERFGAEGKMRGLGLGIATVYLAISMVLILLSLGEII